MKLSTPLVLSAIASTISAADSASSTWTWTTTVTNNGMTYTKTGTDAYTGQPTTEPTAGTYTYTIPKGSRTKLVTNTYGQATTVSTQRVVTGPDETYTKSFTQVVHTTEASSWYSSHSVQNADARAASAGSSGSSASSSSGSGSSSSGAAGALQYGARVGALGVAAALLF